MADPVSGAAAQTGLHRFILLYAVAWVGAVIAYTPLLTILLPIQVQHLAGRTAGVDWLAWLSFFGALAASLGGIFFGWLSDVTRNRRGWIAAGLVLSSLLLMLIGTLDSLAELIVAIILWQLSLNMMLGPLSALAADVVPDRSKGVLGGLQAFAPGLAALVGALVTWPGLANAGSSKNMLVIACVMACILPLLLTRIPAGSDDAAHAPESAEADAPVRARARRMWLARLCVQVAEAALFAYMLFWLSGLDPRISDYEVARLFSAVLLVSAPLALMSGRWSDRASRPIAPLRACASISALGLVLMAISTHGQGAMVAYGLFGVSSSVFLALHSAQTLRILPQPQWRGRDLGIFNLANTVPSLVMPWLALAFVPKGGFDLLFVLLAALALCAAYLLAPGKIEAQD